ncbi:MAG: hemerythrin domain-containing protein, partial [Candidatus Nanoarchaeia archaeon]
VLNNICTIWEKHELREEKAFPELEKQGYVIPVDIIFCEHEDINSKISVIKNAINSGNHSNVLTSLEKQAKELLDILEEHVELEDEVLYRIV